MSQDRSGSPFVLPTFQSILNTQIAKVMGAIDSGEYELAYNCLKTLITSLNPKHTQELRKNDLQHIDDEIMKARGQKSVDSYETLRKQTIGTRNVCRRYIRNLYFKVMSLLHEKGYLEKKREPVEEGKE